MSFATYREIPIRVRAWRNIGGDPSLELLQSLDSVGDKVHFPGGQIVVTLADTSVLTIGNGEWLVLNAGVYTKMTDTVFHDTYELPPTP